MKADEKNAIRYTIIRWDHGFRFSTNPSPKTKFTTRNWLPGRSRTTHFRIKNFL